MIFHKPIIFLFFLVDSTTEGYFRMDIRGGKIMNVLEVSHVKKQYGDRVVVNDISLSVKKGECFGILGHNGAGKTTLVESILGLRKVEGTITLLNHDMKKRNQNLFNKIGVQLQQSAYQDKIKVIEICEERAVLYHKKIDVNEKLKEFNLDMFKNNEVNSLSGGEKQRLSIMLASIHDPEVLFLDELTTGLDAVARREVWNYLKELKTKGKTIILTSHFMDEVEVLCDHVILLENGKELIQDSVKNVIANSPYKTMEEAYLWYMKEEGLI